MSNTPTNSLGAEIKRLRVAQDMSLRGLAGKLNISAAHMSDIEHSKRHPSPKLLAEIAHTLKVSVKELKSFDSRIDPDVRRWAADYPLISEMLSVVRESGDPDKWAKKFIDQVTKENEGKKS